MVTKMERRVFDLEYKGEKGNFEDYYFNRYLREYIDWLESETKIKVSALGTGVKNGERILKRRLVKNIENYN
jgi:hypothetical protein